MRIPTGTKSKVASLVTLLVLSICCGVVFGGTTGQINGTIADKSTGEPLPGVSVIIKGTNIGAPTDFDGFYRIQNVPPGVYELVATYVGYATMTVTDVQVGIDKVTTIDYELSTEAVQMDGVTVVAKHKAIETRITSNQNAIGADELSVLPVKDTKGILATQVGFVKRGSQLHARGGRAGEVVFRVDGVDTNDPLGVNSPRTSDTRVQDQSGRSLTKAESPYLTMDVSSTDIAEISIIKAGWPAEYGNLQSGLVNLATKEGDSRFTEGYIEYTTDDFGSPSLNRYSFNSDRVDVSLSGSVPILQDVLFPKLGFEFPGESFAYRASISIDKTDTYSSYYDYAPDISKPDWGREDKVWDAFRLDVPERQSNSYKASLKFTYKLDAARKINLSYKRDWSSYIDWDWDYRFTPETAPHQETWSELYQVYFTDKPGWLKNTFYEFQVSKYSIAATRKPAGREPGDFLFFDEYDAFSTENDMNHNGRWDDAEPFVDANGNGQYDFGEPFTDLDGDGRWDDAEVFTDRNDNGTFEQDRSSLVEPDNPEPWIDGDLIIGEPYIDINHNSIYDENIDIFTSADDLNGNGKYDGPLDEWSPGVPYEDLNLNNRYDSPDQIYNPGEPYVDKNGNGKWDGSDLFFDEGGLDRRMTYSHRRSDIYTIKLDVTSAPSTHHDLKTGVEYKFIKVRMADLRYPWSNYVGPVDANEPWPTRGTFRDFYWRTPKQGAFYLQDNISYGEMFFNVGFRWDYFVQADEVTAIDENEAIYLSDDALEETSNKFSPRLGVSYPISDKAKVYFNYGHAYQLPEYYRFYARATQNIGSGALPIVGNVNLDYSKTVQYELGIEYLINYAWKLKLSGFYKDQYGLINVIEGRGRLAADQYGNLDYARARGFEFELTKSIADYLTGGAKYEYSWAFGKSSSGSADYYLRADNQQIPLKESALDWDIRHQVTMDATLTVRKDDHPVVAGIKLPDSWGASLLWQFNSGFPYSPSRDFPGIINIGTQDPPANSKSMSPYSNVDVRLYKDFDVKGMNFTYSLWITNLFNKINQLKAYGDTGRADTSQLSSQRVIVTGIEHDKDPANWGPGRNIKMGLSMKF
ncbi:MAG: TonB-dependent receptor [candidate division Zixibacteria bacterium]|nr:TonB-dependent receptor [candidate division Zixibacteria bacterium]